MVQYVSIAMVMLTRHYQLPDCYMQYDIITPCLYCMFLYNCQLLPSRRRH